MSSLYAAAKHVPDPDATAEKWAVAAAVRGASGVALAEKPPDFDRMSNAEFSRTVKEKYGYDPGV